MTVPGDAAHPTWRSTGMGVYRMWRDSGHGVGAILIGLSMEFVNEEAAFYITAVLMFVSGSIVYAWMEETHPDFGIHEPPAPATTPFFLCPPKNCVEWWGNVYVIACEILGN